MRVADSKAEVKQRSRQPGFRHAASIPLDTERLLMLLMVAYGKEATASLLRNEAEKISGHRMARGLLYKILDNLTNLGLIKQDTSGHPRSYSVTGKGEKVLRDARAMSRRIWRMVAGKI